MTVVLSVHLVREHIRRAALSGSPGPAGSSTMLLGRLFHEIAADLVGGDPEKNGFSFLETLDFDQDVWRSNLIPFVYDRLVGPRLTRDQARLQGVSEGVLHMWKAVQAFCGWLVGLAWVARTPKGRKKGLSWDDLRRAVCAEMVLEAEFQDPGWSEPVRLTGVADSVLKSPLTGKWCIQEYKLGRSTPEADLAQVCLYHLILTKMEKMKNTKKTRGLHRSLSLLSFQPELKERIFNEEEIVPAKQRLLDLIGRLAGVSGRVHPESNSSSPIHSPGTAKRLAGKLVEVFEEYGRPVSLCGEPLAGPCFLRFPVNPGRGVKLEQIQKLGREIQVRLGLQKCPFIGVDRGRVVVDIQRPDRRVIRFSEIQDQLPETDPLAGSSTIPVGIDLEGKLATADLRNPLHAHLLVAGTTGSGKTEWLRTAIHGLIRANTPETLRLILIDPKRVAFQEYRDSSFLLKPDSLVYPDAQPVLDILKHLVGEMDNRYNLFHQAGADDLGEYVHSIGKPLPRILCVCDEYYALIAGDLRKRREIEVQINLLGAKARAAGIHLILATQQPSREIIKGALDSNIPARVGLMMVKGEESKMLLGQTGAENLLGKGDLLFKDVGDPVRLQAAIV